MLSLVLFQYCETFQVGARFSILYAAAPVKGLFFGKHCLFIKYTILLPLYFLLLLSSADKKQCPITGIRTNFWGGLVTTWKVLLHYICDAEKHKPFFRIDLFAFNNTCCHSHVQAVNQLSFSSQPPSSMSSFFLSLFHCSPTLFIWVLAFWLRSSVACSEGHLIQPLLCGGRKKVLELGFL